MLETKLQPSVLPHAIIYWRLDGEIYFKTVCYDEWELELALARHADQTIFIPITFHRLIISRKVGGHREY